MLPGKPTENAFIQVFYGKFRQECMNMHWLLSLADAAGKLEAWCRYYNEERPISAIRQNSDHAQIIKKGNLPLSLFWNPGALSGRNIASHSQTAPRHLHQQIHRGRVGAGIQHVDPPCSYLHPPQNSRAARTSVNLVLVRVIVLLPTPVAGRRSHKLRSAPLPPLRTSTLGRGPAILQPTFSLKAS